MTSSMLLLPPGTYDITASGPGDWVHHAGFETLKKLADGLSAEEPTRPVFADLVSIPDVWAQIHLVESALRDKKHSLHARVVNEWRGLLGLMALTSQRTLPVSIEPLDIKTLKPSDPAGPQSAPSFGAVLHALLPQSAVANDANWDNLALILYRKRPIGLLVPNTLVCPIRDYAGALDEAIIFRDGGRLTDPCASAALVPEDFQVIHRLLSSLMYSLKQTVGDDALKSEIVERLNEFDDACCRRGGEEVAHERVGQDALELPPLSKVFAAFRTLNNISGSGEFGALLPPRPEFLGLLNGAILIDPALPNAIGGTAETIRIWDRFTLSQWLNQPELHGTIRKAAAASGYLILTADELFTATLCQLERDTVKAHPKSGQNLVLPFNAVALMFLSPGTLAASVTADRSSINTVAVSLKLMVKVASGGTKELTLRRSYSLTEGTMVKTINSTRLVAWPNFTRPDWTRHLLYHSGNSSVDVYPQACFTVKTANQALAGMDPTQISANLRDLENTLASTLDASRFPDDMARFNRGGMIKLPDPVEAAICTYGEDRVPVGLILFPALRAVDALDLPVQVGIDFGTTNTIVYAKFHEQAPAELKFEDRHVTPYVEKLSEDDQSIIGMEFLPTYKPTVPFMTLLRQRNLADMQRVREVILTDRIFYLFDVKRPIGELALEQAPNRTGATDHSIRVDLKWGKDRSEDIRLFLTQVALQTLAEVAFAGGSITGVNWHISYPLAFSAQHREAFEGLMQRAVRSALDSQVQQKEMEPSVTESLAAAYYFASPAANRANAHFSETVITVDIGGGTTDISLWQEKKLVWQGSLMLAGRNLLIDFLLNDLKRGQQTGTLTDSVFTAMARNNPEIKAISNSIVDYIKIGGVKITAGLEMFVNHPEFSRAFENPLADYIDNKGFQRLMAISELSLAGILQYVAGMARALTTEGKFKNDSHSTFICLGGRGSLLFKTAIGRHQLSRIGTMFQEQAGLTRPVNFIFSEKPKEEVVCGLLYAGGVKQMLTIDPSDVARDFIIGEQIKVGIQELGPETKMGSLPTRDVWRVEGNKELERFVKQAAFNLQRTIDLTPQLWNQIRDAVNSDLSNRYANRKAEVEGTKIGDSGSEGLQPPFIIGLRALIAEISANGIDLPLKG